MSIFSKIKSTQPDHPPDISVVLACFDQARELELALLSFLRQELPRDRYELIVVDDHSSDQGARRVVAGTRRAYPDASVHHVWQHRPDGGSYGSSAVVKNLGTRLARGRYVWFNNAEIVQAGDSLDYVLRQHETSPGPLCLRGRVIDLPFEELWGKSQAELDGLHDATDRSRERVATADHAGLASIPREVLIGLGGIDERFDHWGKEDLDLAARLKRVGVTYRYDENVKSFHVSHPANHRKGPDYHRMCRLLEENDAAQMTVANRGHLWGERRLRPPAELRGTAVVATGPDPEELAGRLERAIYGPGGETSEVLVLCLDAHRRAVADLLDRHFLGLPRIAVAGEEPGVDARRTLARVRTDRSVFWPPEADDPRPAWSDAGSLVSAIETWLIRSASAVRESVA